MPRRLRSVRLCVNRMEERAVPANNLTVVGPAATTVHITTTIDNQTGTLTLSATGADAQLKITDIQDAMKTPGVTRVVVTTADPAAPDGGQPGDITWENATAGDLDFSGFGSGHTLSFLAAHDIDLAGVHFVSGNPVNNANLEFDSSAGGGDIAFHAGPTDSVVFDPSAVASLTVNAGTGAFTYDNAPSPTGFAYARAVGDISVTAGPVTLNNRGGAGLGGWAVGGDLAVSGTTVHVGADLDATGALTVAGSAVQLGGNLTAGGALTVSGPVTLTGNVAVGRLAGDPRGATPSVTVAGTVDGAFALDLNATAVTLQQAVGGATEPTAVRFVGGDVQYGANEICAADIIVGDGFLPVVRLSGTGVLDAAVTVNQDGVLQPAGAGSAGVLPILGHLTLAGGVLGIDLGPTSDQVQVTGDVTINSGFLDAAGFLPGVGDLKVIDFTGTLAGTFANAPNPTTSPILTDADIVTVSHYGPAATGITVAPYTVAFNAVGGSEFDGTGVVARLIGPGVLGAVRQPSGALALSTHGTTAASRLVVTTTANASDDIVQFAGIFVHGSLASISAPKADTAVRVDGTVGTVSLRTVEGLTVGGAPRNRTTLTAQSVPGDVVTAGGLIAKVTGEFGGDLSADSLSSLRAQTITGDLTVAHAIGSIATTAGFSGDLNAASVTSVKVGTVLGADAAGPAWTVAGSVGSVTAGAVSHLALTARSLGTLTVTGRPGAFSGNVTDTTVALSGNTGGTKRVALGTVKVAGAVTDSLFDIDDGNVTSFTVGRFIDSRLFLGYTPNGAFDTGGDFDPVRRGKLGRFATTAIALNDPVNPDNFAFVGSQIAADSFGVVRLSGLDTDDTGVAFGLKFHTAKGSVRVAATGPGSVPVNTDLGPLHVGDFNLAAG